jgi:hypothetical protein
MTQQSQGRLRVAGALAAVLVCGGAATAAADDGWDGVSPNFGLGRGVNQVVEQYDQMSRTQEVGSSQSPNQLNRTAVTDIRASRLDRNRDGVVDVHERQVSRERVTQMDQNQDSQSQSGERRDSSRSKQRRHQ